MTSPSPVPHLDALHDAWNDYGDPRRIVDVVEVSAKVSTNRVYRLTLGDGATFVAKVSSYGSYFLFAQDHDRLFRCSELLEGTRFRHLLARVIGRDGRPYTWYDGTLWAVFYQDIPRAEALPPTLAVDQVECLAREMAELHLACAEIAPQLPPTSNSVKGDAIHLLDQLESPFAPRNFGLPVEDIDLLRRQTHDFLMELERLRYDAWERIPVLIDWNLGNFSVTIADDDTFRLHSRWDYDWFRIEPRLLDFYFLSRVSSATGDRTTFTYSSHTLVEPRFARFISAYHEVFPLTEQDIRFLPEAYRFFLLNYVIREGARFFRRDLCDRFRRETARVYLPELEQLDIRPLLDAIGA